MCHISLIHWQFNNLNITFNIWRNDLCDTSENCFEYTWLRTEKHDTQSKLLCCFIKIHIKGNPRIYLKFKTSFPFRIA